MGNAMNVQSLELPAIVRERPSFGPNAVAFLNPGSTTKEAAACSTATELLGNAKSHANLTYSFNHPDNFVNMLNKIPRKI